MNHQLYSRARSVYIFVTDCSCNPYYNNHCIQRYTKYLLLVRVLKADLGSGIGCTHSALHISLSWGSSEEDSSSKSSKGSKSSLLLLWGSLHKKTSIKNTPHRFHETTPSDVGKSFTSIINNHDPTAIELSSITEVIHHHNRNL